MNPPHSKLSIIIPVLNEARTLASTLQAAQVHRQAGAELIIVDGGSTDETLPLCAGAADQVLQTRRGRASQMNFGAAHAQGAVLLFLHADTRLPERAVVLVADALHSGVHQWGRFDVRISGRSALLPVIAACMNWRSRWSGIATGDQAIFVQREAWRSVGGFPAQPLMEDIALSRRLLRLGRPACIRTRLTTSGRRWDQHGAWRTIGLMWRLRLLYWLGVPAEKLARAYR
jgi:rSAM/selenodomain-associated transferase 2